ncbi:MAG TPA: hypothetical protein VNF46_05360 [Gammaproteobacteria bacterium]|nr:hypothetical protein [Gammaproteobacteria bacterium]
MHKLALALTLGFFMGTAFASAQDTKVDRPLDRLMVYAGTWNLQLEDFDTPSSKAGKETSSLKSKCWRSENYFMCEQFENGRSEQLTVYAYDAKDDTYNIYNIRDQAGSVRTGRLSIKDNVWTYLSQHQDSAKITYFRILNVFTTPKTIRFELDYSPDAIHWTVMSKGTEKKVGGI